MTHTPAPTVILLAGHSYDNIRHLGVDGPEAGPQVFKTISKDGMAGAHACAQEGHDDYCPAQLWHGFVHEETGVSAL